MATKLRLLSRSRISGNWQTAVRDLYYCLHQRAFAISFTSHQSLRCCIDFYSKGVSQAEIGLDKVVVSLPMYMINEVISGLAEQSDMGSKAVFKSTADGPERPTLDAPF